MAELVVRAALALEVQAEQLEQTVVKRSRETLLSYLKHQLGDPESFNFMATVQQVLRTRLKLLDGMAGSQIKAGVLADPDIQVGIEKKLDRCTFTFLHICLIVLSVTDHPAKPRYVKMVEKRFHILFEPKQRSSDVIGLLTMGTGFLALQRYAPDALERVQETQGAEGFLRLIVANGTLVELFRILESVTTTFRKMLLNRLQPDIAAALVDKTIAAGRSIGTLSFAMRELGDANPDLLGRLEKSIDAGPFLRLIVANGTLFELFRTLQYATPTFRAELLDQFQSDTAASLVNKTIDAGRSIGTLHLSIRKLGDVDPGLLDRLEKNIGAGPFLRLIVANGTLFELFRVLQYATPSFRTALLDRLQPDTAADLLEKTIIAGRAIGTLNFTMRELASADPSLLGRLEQVIGAGPYLRLIAANGTLFELFMVLRDGTPTFKAALLDEFQPDTAVILIEKTIAARHSIETFHHTLRRLHRSPGQKKRLENCLGIDGWWRLLIGVGSLNALIQLALAMSDGFSKELVEASTGLAVSDWRAMIARGLFLNACTFVDQTLSDYPESSQAAFRKALADTAGPLAAKATWFDLNPSTFAATSDSDEGRILRMALQTRIDALQSEDLVGLEFREAVNGFAFAWRERPDLRPALAARFRDIIPRRDEWPKEDGEVAALHIILLIVLSPDIASEDARHLLTNLGIFLDREVCGSIHTLPLFLLLWNMAAVHYERGGTGSFRGALTAPLMQIVVEVLRERVSPEGKGPNREKGAQLALGGLLTFLEPSLADKLRSVLSPLTKLTKWLYPEAQRLTFIPALFTLEGIALLMPRGSIFTQKVCMNLQNKSEEYENIGPAIEHLRAALPQHIEVLQPDKLVGLEFSEAVNGLAFAWRERPDLRPALAARFWDIIPRRDEWPGEGNEVAALRVILGIVISPDFPPEDARCLLTDLGEFLDRKVCKSIDTLRLFLLLWSMVAVHYERGSTASFNGALPDPLIEILLEVLQERVSPKGSNWEKGAQLALGGLLVFLAPPLAGKLQSLLVPLSKLTNLAEWLYPSVQKLTFIPALFTLEGLALLRPPGMIFTREVCLALLEKLEEYDNNGPAIEHLRHRVKHHEARDQRF